MTPNDGDKIPEGCSVLRLPKPPPQFVPDRWRPTHVNFRPSTEDETAAKAYGKPVRVSIWDENRTTASVARTFRVGPIMVLRIPASSVRQIGVTQNVALELVYDRDLPEPDRCRPGADGHGGIEGLDKPAGSGVSAKQKRTEVRQAVADECEVDPSSPIE